MPMACQHPVAHGAAIERKAHVRAVVFHGVHRVAIGEHRDSSVAAGDDDDASLLQLIVVSDPNPLTYRRSHRQPPTVGDVEPTPAGSEPSPWYVDGRDVFDKMREGRVCALSEEQIVRWLKLPHAASVLVVAACGEKSAQSASAPAAPTASAPTAAPVPAAEQPPIVPAPAVTQGRRLRPK